MHYYTEHQERETKVIRDIVRWHPKTFSDVLNFEEGDRLFVEYDKNNYGCNGDVDLVAWKNPLSEFQEIIGVEVKVIHLNSRGEFKSKKPTKHNKQIGALEKEGWDYIYFFDIIVVEPEPSWFHSQAFDGFSKYDKTVESTICGHVVFQVNSVSHKPEAFAGSIGTKILKKPTKNINTGCRQTIIESLRKRINA